MHKTLQHPHGPRRIHLGGWKKQTVDHRDEEFRLKLGAGFMALEPSHDNRPICSPVEDQGELGSCTAHMFAGMVEANEFPRTARKAVVHAAAPQVTVSAVTGASDGTVGFMVKVSPANAPAPAPIPTPAPTPTPSKLIRVSRLFEYYGTRKIEGTTSEDSGASIRDAVKCGNKYGVVDESSYPYDISIFDKNPPAAAWSAAATHKVTSYHSIADGDITTMKSAISSGFLVGFGFNVYDYFMSEAMATKGFLNRPGPHEQLQGGHAVCQAGYDDAKKAFLIRNSWGTAWGIGGYFWMAYDYVADTSLCSDFWVVQSSPV